MRVLSAFLGLCGVTFASDVLEWTDSNFKSNIKSREIALVEFFAPWCGHCKRLAPEYEIAATSLKKNDPPVPLVKVDCTESSETCSSFGVSGYPTLKVFRNGKPTDYDGPRDAAGIASFMKSQAGPSSVEIKDEGHLEKKLNGEENVIVGFFTSTDSDWYKTFMSVADMNRKDYSFSHTTDEALLEKFGVKDGIVLFQASQFHNIFEDKQLQYDGSNDASAVEDWIAANFHGMCGHRTVSNQKQFADPIVIAYYNVDYKRDRKGTNYWRNRVMKVAKSIMEQKAGVRFAVSSHSDYAQELLEFGVSGQYDGKPFVCALKGGKKFAMEKDFSVANLKEFVQDFIDDKLEPYLKSEAVPTEQGNVKVVVGKNFDEIVNDEERDVLIEFYAPWCGHCKSLEPKFNELGDKLSNEPGITIAKMDATANDVPSPYQVSGFPTLYFVPKGSKDKPKKYEGGREVNEFIKYLAKESTDEMEGYSRQGKKKKKSDGKKEL